MTSRQPKGVPVGGQFAASEHDEAAPMQVGDLDAYRKEAEELLETASEQIGCSMSFQQHQDGRFVATIYSDDGKIIEYRDVTISFGEPTTAPAEGRSASDVAQIDDSRFVGYENDLAVLRAELAKNTDTYPANMNVEFSPETYWAPRHAGIKVIGYCECADEESGHGIFQGDPKNINDWLDTHTKDHA